MTLKPPSGCVLWDMAGLLIGDVARRVGISAPTIRCYESLGLVKARVDRRPAIVVTPRRRLKSCVSSRRRKGSGSLDEVSEILKLTCAGHPLLASLDARLPTPAGGGVRIRQLQLLPLVEN